MYSNLSFDLQRWCAGAVRPCTSRRCDRGPYILEAQSGLGMTVRDEWYVPVTGYAGLSIGRFNALGL